MNRFWKIPPALAFAVAFATSSFAQILTPQGRLTLTNNTPVMISNVVGATTLYYTPYVGNSLPISNGTSLSNGTFSQLSLDVYDSSIAMQVEDVYAIYVSSAFQLCLVDAWASNARSAGFGLTTLQGVLVNASTLTSDCETPTTNYTVPAKQGIYLGTIYTSENPGSTNKGVTVQFNPPSGAGGTRNLIGIWNAYNRVKAVSTSIDSTGSWTDTSTSWRAADPGTDSWNNITWVDGYAETTVTANYQTLWAAGGTPQAALIGIDLDSTSTTPTIQGAATTPTSTGFNSGLTVTESFPPQLGLHYVQAMENTSGTSPTITFFGSPFQGLSLETEY